LSNEAVLDGMVAKVADSIKDVGSRGVPLAVTLSGPGIDEDGGVPAPKAFALIRNMDKLLKALAAELDGPKVELIVEGIDCAGESFTVRFRLRSAQPKKKGSR
jgi:hypothetical protein